MVFIFPFLSNVALPEVTIIQHEDWRRVFQASLGLCKTKKQQRYAT